MKVVLDATAAFEEPATGIAKATLGLWESCLELTPSLQVTAVHRKRLACALPCGMRSARIWPYLSQRRWRRTGLPLYVWWRRPDLVHFPCNGRVPRLFSRTPVVGTVYDVLPLAIPQFFRSDEERLGYSKRLQEALDRIDLLITVSEYSKREILRNFRVKVEPLVIYPARYPRTRPNGSGRDALTYGEYFLYVGGYSLRKGVAQLVRMFVDLHQKKRLSSRLLLTGRRKYPSEELKHLIEDAVRLNVAEELGYVSDAELFNLLSHAKALAYPSKYEGFGLPPLEAMSVGCPVLTSRCMSLPEVCGDAALYADPDDEREFAGAVMRLEHDGDLREALRAKGRAQAAKFSGRASAEKFLSAVGRLVGTRRSA